MNLPSVILAILIIVFACWLVTSGLPQIAEIAAANVPAVAWTETPHPGWIATTTPTRVSI
ncbi:MAG: hypothetical protein ACD_48C00042G0001, partial [uncultured bacterium]